MSRMLEGVRVLDLTQAYSGPFCCMHLADQGAEVIKIEPPIGDQTRTWGPIINDYSGYFSYFNRGKRGIVLNLKEEEGKEALRKLIKTADVVIENFKAGTFARLGFTYESMKEIKPDIIYGQISGFGREGPNSHRAAYDIIAQAESGLMSITGYPENPPITTGPAVADNYTGTYLSLAVTMALYRRSQTGEGCHVDVAMVDAMFSILDTAVPQYTMLGKIRTRNGFSGGTLIPWGMYEAKDGYFVTGCGVDKHWKSFSAVMGMEELTNDPDYETGVQRAEKSDYIDNRINEYAANLTLEEIEKKLLDVQVPFGRVRDIKQATESAQTKARNMIWEIPDPGLDTVYKIPGTPMKFRDHDDAPTISAPMLGQHSEEILKEVGYSEEEITALKEKGVTNW